MANDWKQLQLQFLADNDKTSITAKEWCHERGLNYQSARRYIKMRTAQNKTAQFNNVRNAQSGTAQSKKVRKVENIKEEDESAIKRTNSKSGPANTAKRKRKSSSSKFKNGKPGNPHPSQSFDIGNQHARKHGGYSARFDDQSLFDEAAQMSLEEELKLCRARALNCIDTMKQIRADMVNAESVEQRIELYNVITSTEQALDRNVVRIESITKTLSSIRIDTVNEQKIMKDTDRIEAATTKLKLEADNLAKEGKASITPISEMIAELQETGSDGLMS
ncbi:terminase [Photobacterium phosphoreum]|uniref:Terminase n=1 Tax=Photobacterium phosphoreum TaxID=659 RepID=A0A2T3JQ07_PHOPO|nr:terminase [Photobacterium phosphoreum]PSU24691.1 terminase [Photobacterium phosphoreum]PSU38251.1 terminase [Photobacterium phosphoreum]PSU51135.1 terminase [Photobacterium phosphoreum]